MAQVTVVARIVAKADSVDDLKRELLKIVEPTRKEDGCIDYNLHQDNDNPAVFVFYENWRNEQALEQHMGTPHCKALIAATGGIAQDMSVSKLTQLA